jgi:hypothetical protein
MSEMKPNPKGVMEKNNRLMIKMDREREARRTGKSTPRSKALKGEKEFEKWRSSRSGTHSPKIAKKLGIKLYE